MAPTPTPTPAPTSPTPAPSATATPGAYAIPQPIADSKPPRLKVKVKRVGRRFRITLIATDPSGVKRITFRIGRTKAKRYRRPLLLKARDAKRLRVRAEDKLGNRTRQISVKLPKAKRS